MKIGEAVTQTAWGNMVQKRQGRYRNNMAYEISAAITAATNSEGDLVLTVASSSSVDYNTMEITYIEICSNLTDTSFMIYQTSTVVASGTPITPVAVNRLGTPTPARFASGLTGGTYTVLGATALSRGVVGASGKYEDRAGWVIGSEILSIENILIRVTNDNLLSPASISVRVHVVERYLSEYDNDIIGPEP